MSDPVALSVINGGQTKGFITFCVVSLAFFIFPREKMFLCYIIRWVKMRFPHKPYQTANLTHSVIWALLLHTLHCMMNWYQTASMLIFCWAVYIEFLRCQFMCEGVDGVAKCTSITDNTLED